MTTNFIARIQHLELAPDSGEDFVFRNSWQVTTNRKLIRQLLSPELREACGELEARQLERGPVLFIQKTAPEPVASTEDISQELLNLHYNIVQHALLTALQGFNRFTTFLWALTDNCVYAGQGFAEVYVQEGSHLFVSVSFAPAIHLANGGSQTVTFTRQDWERALEYADSFCALLSRSSVGESAAEDGKKLWETISNPPSRTADIGNASTSTRLGRFFYFLQAARCASDLGVRIALLSTCLETLFSTDSSELSHKVAERTAAFVEIDTDARIDLFRFIKKAYSLRSKVVHGSNMTPRDEKELAETAQRLDFHLRRVFGRILTDTEAAEMFLLPAKDLEDRLLRLIWVEGKEAGIE